MGTLVQAGERRLPPWLWLPSIAVVLVAILPLLGLWMAYHEPAGLIAAPPLSFGRLVPLLGRSLALSVLVGAASLFLGSWFAWVEVRTRYVGRRWWAGLSLLPLACPSYLIATVAREQFAPAGELGALLGRQDLFTGFGPAVLVLTVACTPYVHLLAAAALRRCPSNEEEAARSLGASTWRIVATVIAPRLRPTWAFGVVLVCLYVVSDFGAVAVLDCEVLTWELYKVRDGREAVVLGCGLMLVVLPLLLGVRALHGRTAIEQSLGQSEPRRQDLGGGALLFTLVAHGLVIGLGVVLPMLSLVHWVVQGLDHKVNFANVVDPALTTLGIAGIGALFILLATSFVAWLTARHHGRGSVVLENSIYLTSAVPGVLIAVGMLKLITGLKRQGSLATWESIEAAGVFLFLGLLVRFASQAYAALKPSFLRLDQTQNDSARILGASAWRRLLSITVPAIKPSLVAAYALVFLSVAKELPVTLMLIPLGHTTLAYRIFDSQQEAALPDVGLAGLTLLSVALVLQGLLNRWRRHV